MGPLIIDWARLVPALLLLLTPVSVLQGPRVHFREIARDWERHWPQIRSLWIHYFDFVRAALGGWLLLDAVTAAPGAHGVARYAGLIVLGVVRILASLMQTAFCKEPDSFNAPFAFLTGLLIIGVPPIVSGIALTLVLTFTCGARAPAAYFPLLALAFPPIGAFFEGKDILVKLAPGSCAALLPWIWSLLFHRDLVVSYRSSRIARTEPPFPRPARKP